MGVAGAVATAAPAVWGERGGRERVKVLPVVHSVTSLARSMGGLTKQEPHKQGHPPHPLRPPM